jgi:drug/metabolite transporter (DMT)-like permease
VLALVAFFEALKAGESTSVVPLIGTGIPIMTLIGSIVATQEKPSTYGYLGFSILIISAFLLTWKKKTQKTDKRALYTSLVAILLFSISNVLGKVAFQVWPFLSVFVVSRIACFIVAIILLWLDTQARAELKQFIGGKTKSSSKITGWTRLLLLLGQIGGAVGFLLVNIGLSKGNAGLVTALQATQYALIAMVGWFGGARMTKLLSEEISTEAKLKKGLAFIGIAIGLWFTTR